MGVGGGVGDLSHFAFSLQQGVSSNAVHIYDFHTFTVIYRKKNVLHASWSKFEIAVIPLVLLRYLPSVYVAL